MLEKWKTVKGRIFISNACMVFVALALFLLINLIVIEIYSETIETELLASVEHLIDEDGMKQFIENWTIQRNSFIAFFIVDGVVCIIVLLMVSQLFTNHLTQYIMKPLDELLDGTNRIRINCLTQNIEYTGSAEFENLCHTFNDMQGHILEEQEKNRKYEKARTDMIAGISHDLKTPLTAIKGSIKALLDGIATTPERKEQFLQTAYRRSEDMDTLLNQLFYLSKMETGNMPIHLSKIELNSFVHTYVQAKQEYLKKDEQSLTFETDGSPVRVAADPEQLCRILDNLMENSRKYAEVTPLEMKITLSGTGSGVGICFSDNGAGVPADKLPHIFEEFYRGDESRNRREGNGLGLYIVKYLIEAMKGHVWAENAGGLHVYMELPILAGEEVEENGKQ